jgi:hypothetical protein
MQPTTSRFRPSGVPFDPHSKGREESLEKTHESLTVPCRCQPSRPLLASRVYHPPPRSAPGDTRAPRENLTGFPSDSVRSGLRWQPCGTPVPRPFLDSGAPKLDLTDPGQWSSSRKPRPWLLSVPPAALLGSSGTAPLHS